MSRKWKKTNTEMKKLTEYYLSVRKSERKSVHKTLVQRAFSMLSGIIPEAAEFYLPLNDIIISSVCRPDSTGDYEKGTGRHYYCVTNSRGIRKFPSKGYYKNGIRKYAKSARTMFEEDYTMALTMYKAGYTNKAAVYFARAVHMISDICCLPHVTGMTYYSSKKEIHKAYESLARAMYPDALPERSISMETLCFFNPEKDFGDALNDIAEAQADDIGELHEDPVKSITNRLYKAEEAVAALMYRFMCDTLTSSGISGFIADNAVISGQNISISVSTDGLRLLQDEAPLSVMTDKKTRCNLFRAAHRFDGLYTFSPVSDKNGRSLIIRNRKLRPFNPHRDKQLYRIDNPEINNLQHQQICKKI